MTLRSDDFFARQGPWLVGSYNKHCLGERQASNDALVYRSESTHFSNAVLLESRNAHRAFGSPHYFWLPSSYLDKRVRHRGGRIFPSDHPNVQPSRQTLLT